VTVCGVCAHHEFTRDLLVGEPQSYEAHDIALACGEIPQALTVVARHLYSSEFQQCLHHFSRLAVPGQVVHAIERQELGAGNARHEGAPLHKGDRTISMAYAVASSVHALLADIDRRCAMAKAARSVCVLSGRKKSATIRDPIPQWVSMMISIDFRASGGARAAPEA
jgi:hypothetical protein